MACVTQIESTWVIFSPFPLMEKVFLECSIQLIVIGTVKSIQFFKYPKGVFVRVIFSQEPGIKCAISQIPKAQAHKLLHGGILEKEQGNTWGFLLADGGQDTKDILADINGISPSKQCVICFSLYLSWIVCTALQSHLTSTSSYRVWLLGTWTNQWKVTLWARFWSLESWLEPLGNLCRPAAKA